MSKPPDLEVGGASTALPNPSNPHSLRQRPSHYSHSHHNEWDEAHQRTEWRSTTSALPFAGRVGANLTSTNCNTHSEIIHRTPDAAKLTSARQVVDVYGFREPIYLKAATIECVAMFAQVWIGGMIDNAVANIAPQSSPLAVSFGVGVTTWLTITLWLFATAPASGGHVNPFITMLTFTTGLCTLPRAVYYIVGQMAGAVAGGWFLKLGLQDHYYPGAVVGGCTINTSLVPPRQAFVLELGTYFAVGFLAIGVGLDPRQGELLGPVVAPVLVGAVVALCSWGSGAVVPGYYGVSLNPGRCFGLLGANRTLWNNWIHWVAGMTAACMLGVVYNAIPPYYKGLALERRPRHHEHGYERGHHGHSHEHLENGEARRGI